MRRGVPVCRGETFVEVAGASNDFRRAAASSSSRRLVVMRVAPARFVCITDCFDLRDQINLI